MIRASCSIPLKRLLVLFAAVLAAGILHADEFWKNKPRSEWSLKETLKLLEDSPWSRQEVRTILRPGVPAEITFDRSRAHCDPDKLDANGNCLETRISAPKDSSASSQVEFSTMNDVVFLIRWESSAKVEDAFAHLAEMGERATAQYLSIPPRLPADRYVVTLKALEKYSRAGVRPGPMPVNSIGPIENDAAGPRARLMVGNLSVVPVESERYGVGAGEAVHFYFPRQVDGVALIRGDGPSRVTFEFRGERFSVKTHFSLTADMLR